MEGAGIVAVGALLLALLAGIVAAMLWQETRRGSLSGPPVYVLEEAVTFVHGRLRPEVGERLSTDDVRRILEWEVLYLQRGTGEPVAGGPEAIRYVRDRAAATQGVEYRENDVAEVLEGEAEYLAAIGAVGEEVER